LNKYKSVLNEPSIENHLINQRKYYNKILISEISNNLNTLSKISQTFDNLNMIENLLTENSKLIGQIDTKLATNSEINKIIQRNESYVAVKNKIIERQNEKVRSEKEYYDRNYYNGHKIYTGPRGGRYYINSNGNKVYLK